MPFGISNGNNRGGYRAVKVHGNGENMSARETPGRAADIILLDPIDRGTKKNINRCTARASRYNMKSGRKYRVSASLPKSSGRGNKCSGRRRKTR